jgi:AcrR family transcriptional regulator
LIVATALVVWQDVAMASAPRTAREFARIELTRAILTTARADLAAVGPGALSLRAVARELGMASSAVYRYFPSRDHLITALLVECYNESAAAVEEAEKQVPRSRYRKRWLAATSALRDWARANRFEYALLYGSPVPGYAAPQDTIGPAQRVPQVLLAIVVDIEEAHLPLGSRPATLTRAQRSAMAPISAIMDSRIGDERLARALMAWATLIGQTSLELFGHLHQGVLDYDAHFRRLMENVADDLGLPR